MWFVYGSFAVVCAALFLGCMLICVLAIAMNGDPFERWVIGTFAMSFGVGFLGATVYFVGEARDEW